MRLSGTRRVPVAVLAAVASCGLFLSTAYAQPTPAPPPVESGVEPGDPVPDNRPGEAFADPKIAELQRTASTVQRELGGLAQQIHVAEEELRRASDTLAAARVERERADAVVAGRQKEVDSYAAAMLNSVGGSPSDLRVLLAARNPRDFLDGAGFVDRIRSVLSGQLAGSVQRQRTASSAEGTARDAEAAAIGRKADLDKRTGDATNRAAAVSSELRGKLAEVNSAVIASQKSQQERNEKTAANWRAYVERLRANGIVPPPMIAMRDAARLPAGLVSLPGMAGPQPGAALATIAGGEQTLVLPAEIIKAVSTAMDTLGKPYVPGQGGGGPTAYSCDGLVRAVYEGAGIGLPGATGEQMAVLTPVPIGDAQPGDVVFLGPARYGVQGVGIVLDPRTMLTADARVAGVVVTDIPAGDAVLGMARPALAARPPAPVPQRTDDGPRWRCGGAVLPPRANGDVPRAWGGYPNGLIPMAALCGIGSAHALRCDAAQAYMALSQAFGGVFGRQLCITDSYRTFESQVRLYGQKPSLAAVPGTSNHGWGLAVDLCGGVQSFGTAEYGWLARNAPAFGWANPGWARPGQGREEPWHWEFMGG
ncbi:NlpC/P60 family protein [Herbihabitans rhizosphaerae]|uniref:NlpC/P60 family protein n=1 Tax=Herbihabitans rhizosphaerae TaxID=1872711 RepID=A0A4V2ESV6_9PSEU|nr:D-alanyl-D-alanine carboxypeptidase family protein [Herbihabitans rhizosphaerae]RZS38903.1 NlpC/P60 family protein [Herbihabitans rhizosphaerae]